MIILKSRVTCTFTHVARSARSRCSAEEITTGERRLTSRAYLTFVAIDRDGRPQPVPPLLLETEDDGAASASRAPRGGPQRGCAERGARREHELR